MFSFLIVHIILLLLSTYNDLLVVNEKYNLMLKKSAFFLFDKRIGERKDIISILTLHLTGGNKVKQAWLKNKKI